MRSLPCMAIWTVGAYGPTKVGNRRQVLHLETFSFGTLGTRWSLLVRITLPRMMPLKYIMINLVYGRAPSCMVLASQISIGQRHWSIWCIYTTIWYISPLDPLLLRCTITNNPIWSTSKTFGSRVCVKCSGNRNAKLDKHDFHGIFLGFTATDQDIIYLDLDTGIVKQSHQATFDEAWYLQPSCPPAAQLLYDLG